MIQFPPGIRPARRSTTRATVLAALVSLAAWAGAPQPSRSDTAALSACRQRANEVYAKQNRAELYRTDTFTTGSRDSPFSTADLPSMPTRGLSGQYERDTMVSDCLAGTGAATGISTSAAPAPSAKPPVPQP